VDLFGAAAEIVLRPKRPRLADRPSTVFLIIGTRFFGQRISVSRR
jgi:hypothetical protein